jgi:hypothetical protein
MNGANGFTATTEMAYAPDPIGRAKRLTPPSDQL